MGSFGYMCPKCCKNVRAGELCVLRSVLHGEVIDQVVGHYDEYGSVEEENTFDVEKSNDFQFNYDDSSYKIEVSRVYNGKLIESFWYWDNKTRKYYEESMHVIDRLQAGEIVTDFPECPKYEDTIAEWRALPVPDWSLAKSGVSAYHKYCFDRLSDEEKNKNIPSRTDPDQSWGGARKKYM